MFETEGTPPPNDFRMESVVPTKEDLLFDGEPYLRKNIVKGPYDDAEHYLDVHFRLLREDSLRVLRDGVRQYRQHGYKPRKKVTEAIVYKNVRIGMPVSVEDGGMVSEAKFRARICNSVRQLMHGSLVVLSNDNFAKNFLFATVYHRNRLDLDAGYVTLEFFMNQGPVDYSSQYQIMESPAFFEAYRHVLRGLQSFARGEDIPLSKYLIKLNTSPGLPSYFQEARTFDMDFSILSDERRSWIVDVREAHEIVTPDDIGLDPSQQKALMMALQQELAVIQGPPGTGKTYLGHQICRLLLANQRLWNSDRRHPMLVVCYSNHALDQFLAGVLNNMIRDTGRIDPYNIQRHMVRVGTRCHNPDFKPYMLNEIRRHHKDRFSRDLNAQRRKIQEERREIVEKIGEISTDLAMASNGVMPIDKLIIPKERVISKDHEEEFMLQRSDGFTVYTLGEVFFHWLADEHRPADVEHDILEAEPFTEEDVACITDIYKMPLYKRWRLYSYWMVRFRVKKERQLQELQTQYDNLTRRMAELRQRQDLEILKSARVIGMTTTGAARLQSILATIQCPIVIVEEAAEVFEAHIVTALTVHCKHVILIGDHKQLRPTPEVYDLGRQFHLDVSLFERLMKNNFPYVMLQYQHRMRPEISQAVMPLFYDNLRDDPSVRRYPPVAGMDKNFVFINHHSPEENSEALVSHLNKYEGEYAVRIALYLLHQGYLPQQIAIITPYVEQMMYIRRRADELICRGNGVRIEAVDSYQGEESDLVILSLVRSLNPEGKIGFLRVQNRVCVAMSRAKMGLYVLGNIDFLADDCELWDRMKTTLENRGVLSNVLPIVCQDHGRHQDITIWRDFAKAAAEGGCFEPCDFRLDCGHACNRLCHPTPHDDVDCTEPCARACPVGHPCDKLCSDPCGDCMQDVPVDLPCGHRSTKPCYTTYRPVPCDQRCLKTFPCGHQCQKTCSEPCPTVCHELVQKRFKCGHSAEMACSDDVSKGRCGGKSMKRWSACGHEIEADCWLDPAKIPCPHPCGMTLTDCKHTCKGTCGGCRQGRLHIRCEERCKRILFCGHPCTSTCSGVCPPCDRTCETECFHSRCAVPSNGSTKKKSRKCGELCPPCVQDCANICEHRSCSQKCMKPCDVDPCEERCSKNLYCGHRCMGLCGEDCPLVCRDCPRGQLRKAYEAASEMFLGFEAEDDALFIQLGCGHCIESRGMDRWIQELIDGSSAIVQICCPKCRAPVKKSRRYQRQVTQRMNDMEQIKKSLIGGRLDRLDGMRQDIMESVKTEVENAGTMSRTYPIFSEFCHVAMGIRSMMSQPMYVNKELVDNFSSLERFIDQLWAVIRAIEQQPFTHCQHDNVREAVLAFFGMEDVSACLKREWMTLLYFLENDLAKPTASALMYDEYGYELNRLDRAFQVMKTLHMCDETGMLPPDTLSVLGELNKLLNYSTKSNADSLDEFNRLLKLISREVRVLYKEREEIRRGLGRAVTSWYKCPNGHLYGIGDCGRAEVVGTCPDCGAEIGGTQHVVREGNTLDRKMTMEQRRTAGVPLDGEANPFQAIF